MGIHESMIFLYKHLREVGSITIGTENGIRGIITLAKEHDLWFGPDKNILDALIVEEALGYIDFDDDTGKYSICNPRRPPNLRQLQLST
jgi:hypothetical protein